MRLVTTIISIVLASNLSFAQPEGEAIADPLSATQLVERVQRCESTLDKCATAWTQQRMFIGVLQEGVAIRDAQIKDISSALVDARKRSIFERPEIMIPLSVILGFGAGALIAK